MPHGIQASQRSGRLFIIDFLRGAAVALMVVFHLCWDLVYFGHAEFDLVGDPAWRAFNRLIVTAFLMLVGVGLVLAHRRGFRLRLFIRRVLMITGCALAITAASRLLFPDNFIYFGVLHCIAASSVLALAFLRLPPLVVAVIALGCTVTPHVLTSAVFDQTWLWWLGLSPGAAPANDFVPILPWFGAVLGGVAVARALSPDVPIGAVSGDHLTRWPPLALAAWMGRHSLAIYMIHQPILLAVLFALSIGLGFGTPGSGFAPAPSPWDQDAFAVRCQGSCQAALAADPERKEAVCTAYCGCLIEALEDDPQARDELARWDGTPEALRNAQNAGPIIAACEREAWHETP